MAPVLAVMGRRLAAAARSSIVTELSTGVQFSHVYFHFTCLPPMGSIQIRGLVGREPGAGTREQKKWTLPAEGPRHCKDICPAGCSHVVHCDRLAFSESSYWEFERNFPKKKKLETQNFKFPNVVL